MDQMTPLERQKALRQGEAVDRLPITVSHEIFSAKLVGLNYREAFNSAENVAKKEINLYQTYGIDGISVSYTSVNFGIRHRSKIKSPQFNTASIDQPALKNIADWKTLDHQNTEFKRDVAQQVNVGAIKIMQDQLGDEIQPTYSFSAPFTMATGVIAPEQMLKGMIKSPEEVHGLLHFVSEFIKQLIDSALDLGVKSFFIYDPVASGSLIGPKQFQKFCLPYLTDLVSYIKERCPEAWVGMHICGNTTDRLQDIAQTGIDGFSLDQKVDLAEAKDLVGDQLTLLGNIDPIRVFLQGDPELMKEEVKTAYDKAKDNPKGFIIRSGCGVPYEADVENFDAYVQASKKYSQM